MIVHVNQEKNSDDDVDACSAEELRKSSVLFSISSVLIENFIKHRAPHGSK